MKKLLIFLLFFGSVSLAIAQAWPTGLPYGGGVSGGASSGAIPADINAYKSMMDRYIRPEKMCLQTTTKKIFVECKLVSSLTARHESSAFFKGNSYCAFLNADQAKCAKGNTGILGGCYALGDDCVGTSFNIFNSCRAKCIVSEKEPLCGKKTDCTGSTARSHCTAIYSNMPTTVFRPCTRPQARCDISTIEGSEEIIRKRCLSLDCSYVNGKCFDPSENKCIKGEKCSSDADCNSKTPKCDDVGPVAGTQKYCTNGDSSCHDSKCLSSASIISTPIGGVSVTSLKVGDIVWTADRDGNRIVRTLVKVSRVAAPNHRVVHLVLADGRAVDVSAPHPTADGRTVGDLQVGEVYSGSVVTSAKIKPYEGTATYDILPAGDTGYYWANGILMGSTLK